MAKRVFVFVVIVILAILVPRIIRLIQLMKFGKVIYNHQPGPCQLIKGVENGSEDMQALSNGMVFITNGLKFEKDVSVSPWKDIKGQIMLFDANTPDKRAVPLKIEGNIDLDVFNPHGISIWQEKGKVTLFVVNHPPGRELVEMFTFDVKHPTKLKHEETIESEFILFPNDVVAVGPRQFYVTNYLKFHGPGSILSKLETFAMLHLGTVAYYDGKDSKIVLEGFLLANGINKSPDGKFIYVMNIGDEELRVYQRHPNNSLELKQVVNVGVVDNLDVDPVTGDLWGGAHPALYLVGEHFEKPYEHPAPSQALHMKTENGLVTDIHEVYSEDGTKFVSGSSVAVHYKNRLMIGTVCHRAVVCDILHKQ